MTRSPPRLPAPADFHRTHTTRHGHLLALGGSVYFIEGRSAVGSKPMLPILPAAHLREPQVDLGFREANDLHCLTRGGLSRDNANALSGYLESFGDDRFHR